MFLSENTLPKFSLPKSFILLAGISGTGKTRFVKEQAQYFRADGSNFQLVSVRPDWHEPSDLLGYISRLGNEGAKYIATDFLQFIVAAWKHIIDSIEHDRIHYKSDGVPYWLCLDEMNLAPVEQYFADYLSVIETRHWDNEGVYHCSPLLNAGVFARLGDVGLTDLRSHLGLHGLEHDALWAHFQKKGISIPPNLIVAGTVNMDETTHGFSRKVIDRAFTLDFGEFFPNDYQAYFSQKTRVKALTYPTISQVDISLIAAYDPEGQQSITFLEAINAVLKGSPFELAYRALNELLIAVVCFMPKEAVALQAVWDDFLMTKVLPRIEGDSEKLQDDGENSLLTKLEGVLAEQLNEIWAKPNSRPDFLREGIKGEPLAIACRCQKKLAWMKARLSSNGFTAFWP
ncbi:MAG: restriction endonuclease [Methylococcaceae bacterium]|nr:restriction endonuclease [Methylococcaceae bacterium]